MNCCCNFPKRIRATSVATAGGTTTITLPATPAIIAGDVIDLIPIVGFFVGVPMTYYGAFKKKQFTNINRKNIKEKSTNIQLDILRKENGYLMIILILKIVILNMIENIK